eukprot:TRINITY_DN25590_c0_g1_i1.p1 TRINITY_DN25590_c0_g1~~TRINITY_DN25590_c0_g1_i1.p1  ORF type:complete len:1101 (+),score=420.49 TRINITY_DN25590_c0_g1_i1:85-3387(+)
MDVWPRWLKEGDAQEEAAKIKERQEALKFKGPDHDRNGDHCREHVLPVEQGRGFSILAAKIEAGTTAMFYEETKQGQPIRKLVAFREYEDAIEFPALILQQGRGSWELHSLSLDPSGQHIIASFRSGETWYCNTVSRKAAQVNRVSNRISAVGWNKHDQRGEAAQSTGLILLGDSSGGVYIARFNRDGECSLFRKDLDLAKHMENNRVEPPAITGIVVDKEPTKQWLVVLMATATRLWEFVGGPTLLDVLPKHKDKAHVPRYVKVHPGPCDVTGGVVLYRPTKLGKPVPRANVAWCSSRGIYHCTVEVDAEKPDESVIKNGSYFSISPPAPADPAAMAPPTIKTGPPAVGNSQMKTLLKKGVSATSVPDPDRVLGIFVGPTYMLLLFEHSLCLVAQPAGLRWRGTAEPHDRISHEDLLSRTLWKREKGWEVRRFNPVALLQPALDEGEDGDVVYLVMKGEIRKLVLESENNVSTFKSFFSRALDQQEPDRGQYFEAASSILAADEREKREQVRIRAADYYFESGNYAKAAELYARSKVSFENTVMRFVQCGDKSVLLTYLTARIQFIKDKRVTMVQETSQLACLTTWTAKIFLDVLRDTPEGAARTAVRERFYEFVKGNLATRGSSGGIVKEVLEELLQEYQMPNELLWFGMQTKNYPLMVQFYMMQGQYLAALHVLETHCKSEDLMTLWYQYSPQLITKVPVQLIDAWMDHYDLRAGKELICALIKYHPKYNPPGVTQNQAIKYLKWLVELQDTDDQATHNLLIQIYIQQSEDEEDAVDYLRDCQRAGRWHFDEKYALRIALQNGRHRFAICIYALMELYSDAVALAIATNNIDLGKRIAREPAEAPLRKRLALQIVEYVINRDSGDASARNSTQTAIEMVQDFKDIKLEDILPFFKEDVIIRGVSQELHQVVGGYSQYLEDLKLKMTDLTDAARDIEVDIDRIREHAVHIPENAVCGLCDQPVLSRNNFYAFACGHSFHQDCLQKEVRKSLQHQESGGALGRAGSPRKQQSTGPRIAELAQIVREYELAERPTDPGELERRLHKVVEAKRELDLLVAAQCPYCGDTKIREAALPFLDGDEDDTWDIVELGHQQTRSRR